ncbi:MAG TPA: hypothetical protein VM537_21230 [Anaerolineae bacterium]|nr:hypothetical protein [Anaerolineae bacterium]
MAQIGDVVQGRVLYVDEGTYERHFWWQGMLLGLNTDTSASRWTSPGSRARMTYVLRWRVEDASSGLKPVEVQQIETVTNSAQGAAWAMQTGIRAIEDYKRALPRTIGLWVEAQNDARKERAEIGHISV